MIRVRFLRSFDESLDALDSKDRKKVQSSAARLLDYFDGGPKPLGLGLRKLQGGFWEVRAGLDRRILFLLEGDLAAFIIAGSHDEIRRRLRAR